MPNIDDTIAARIAEDCKPVDIEQLYREALDEFGPVQVGGLQFNPSEIIEKLDPIAFRCGVSDYEDSLDVIEIGSEYYWKRDIQDKVLYGLASDLESEISDLETEREEAEENEEDTSSIDEQLAAKRADLKAVETFLD
jgi:hypothetical protein